MKSFVKFEKENEANPGVVCHLMSDGKPVTVFGIHGNVWQLDGHLSKDAAIEQVKSKLN